MSSSTAVNLLTRQLKELTKNPVEGFSAGKFHLHAFCRFGPPSGLPFPTPFSHLSKTSSCFIHLVSISSYRFEYCPVDALITNVLVYENRNIELVLPFLFFLYILVYFYLKYQLSILYNERYSILTPIR